MGIEGEGMTDNPAIFVGASDADQFLLLKYANRHGLISGATVTEIGPVLMARLLQLNDTQEGVLNIVFKVADEQGLLLLDFKDLQSVLQWTAENAGSLTTKYGNVSKQTVGTIQRALLTLEQQG